MNVPDGNKPSGATVRIVNLYNPIKGAPGPIDIYAAPWVEAGAKPLLSVPYGQVSPPFDPTVADDQGDMFLSFYASGVTGNGSELMSQDETLKGGENIVFYLATGDLQDTSGTYGGELGTQFAPSASDTLDHATPPAGKALVNVQALGLDKVLTNAATTHWIASFGAGCDPGLGGDANDINEIDPGSGVEYAVEAGQTTLSLHLDPQTSSDVPDCKNASALDVPLTTKAGEYDLLMIYAPKDGELKTLFMTVSP